MSASLGSENFSGSDSTSAARQSFGKPKPMVEPSFEKERKTMRPTRNLMRPRTNASLLRGRVLASCWTSATVTGMGLERYVGRTGLVATGHGELVLRVLDPLLELPAVGV